MMFNDETDILLPLPKDILSASQERILYQKATLMIGYHMKEFLAFPYVDE